MRTMNLEQIQRFYLKAFPIYRFIGIEVLDSAPLTGRCKVELTEDTANHIGTVHAGVQWILSEAVGGVIVMRNLDSRRYALVIGSLDIQFKRRAVGSVTATGSLAESEWARVRSELEEDGRSEFELKIDLEGEAGVATQAVGRYHLREIAE